MPKFNLDIDNDDEKIYFPCDNCKDPVWIRRLFFNADDPNEDLYVCEKCIKCLGTVAPALGFDTKRLHRTKSSDTHVLYRHYDRFHELLYIGITNDPISRFSQHRHKSAWWLAVVDGGNTTYQRFPNRVDLLEAERSAIRTERPRYNSQHNG